MTGEVGSTHIAGDLTHVRELDGADRDALLALNEHVSDRSLYRRFFIVSHHAADAYVDQLLRPSSVDHHALVGLVNGELVGVASYERVGPATAEIAVLIEDRYQHMGIGSTLIEKLAAVARRNGIRRLVADVMTGNTPMIALVRQLELPTSIRSQGDTVVMSIDIGLAA